MRKIKPRVNEYMEGPMAMSSSKKKSDPIYPTVRIDLEHIPEAKDWKVGDEYTIEMKVRMTGLSQSRFDNSAEFEIREIETGDADESESGKDGNKEND